MTGQLLRIPGGGAIDLSRPLQFTFDGRTLSGFAGDTLASALLANGVRLLGRSFKYHRPRGLLAAGSEEPNALLTIGSGADAEPNARATMVELYDGLVARSQNAWPSLAFDIGAISQLIAPFIPAGFYYKTFIGGPKNAWTQLYEPAIRRLAGLGRAPDEPDGDIYDKRHAHCDLLVIGAGPAGLSAALAGVASGSSVILIDENADAGGMLRASEQRIEGLPAAQWARDAAVELAGHEACRLLLRTTAFGRYDDRLVMAVERRTDHEPSRSGPRQRLWQIRAGRIVLATGAHEQPLLFANNDLPGVMLAGAAQLYARHYGVLAGRRIVVATSGGSGLAAAHALAGMGADIRAVADGRAVAAHGALRVCERSAVVRAIGRRSVTGAEIVSRSGARQRIACDAILMSGGWQPALHLYSHVGGRTRYDERLGCFVAAAPLNGIDLVGACAGSFDLDACLAEGRVAGHSPRHAAPAKDLRPVSEDGPRTIFAPEPCSRSFVDFQNDVTVADIRLAALEGFVSVEHLKRYTTTGMATDQGKTSNVNALKRLADHLGAGPGAVGTTTFRPPYTPVSFGALAGLHVGDLMDPVRRTPMHDWHVAHGAEFENVGQWKRAFCYPKSHESMAEAVRRECNAVRTSAGMFDASTLGKIDIRGPDTARFLDLVYTNSWTKLEIGRCRYGLMLGENGMVVDDGVTTRTGPDRYLMSTTTGNAAFVMEHLEDLLQTEWPSLKVFVTSVTEHWAATVVTGPNARKVLKPIVERADLSKEAMPHLSMREGWIAGIPVRIYRISFTGELSFEVHCAAQYGAAVWAAIYEAGTPFGIVPYGTEATHVLRAEKGYIIIGQETDGTVTPLDLGLDWAISKVKADFIGKRSLERADMKRPDRRHLVGLRPLDRSTVVEEGAQLLAPGEAEPPATMLGHVTSSYFSESSGGSFALALLSGGRERHGTIVHAWSRGRSAACEVCAPIFYDIEGARIHA